MTDFDELPEEMPAPPEMPSAETPAGEESQRQAWLSEPAPYGRFKNGKPRKSPAKGGGGKRRTASTARTRPGTPDYARELSGLFQVGAWMLSVPGQKNPALMADAKSVATHGPNISVALGDLADQRPEIAAVLDRILAAGPYTALIGAIAPLVYEVGVNHGVLPAPTPPPEAVPREENHADDPRMTPTAEYEPA